jgi:hypothetical protein
MPYGTVKVDNVTFTNNSVDATTTFSGIYASITNNLTLSGTATAATFTGTTANFTNVNAQNISVTTSLSGLAITGGTAGFTTITGTTVTGTTANFATLSGTTVTGTTANFVTVSGTTVTGNTGQFTNLAGAAAGFTTVTGTTITGTTANFVSGVFTTRILGTTVTGTTASFTSGVFTSLSGTTHTITSGVFASGTAALPSISFVSDPNTGIYSPGADQLAVATNGTGRLFVNSTGVITTDAGITSSQFNIVNTNSVSTYDRLLAIRNGSLTTAFLGLGLDSFYIASATGSPMVFCTNSDGGVSGTSVPTNERLRITSAGLVGIGTSSPNSSATLTTSSSTTDAQSISIDSTGTGGGRNGSLIFRGTYGVGGGGLFDAAIIARINNDDANTSANSQDIAFYTKSGTGAPTSKVTIKSSGNVGIGTTTPGRTLDVVGSIRSGGSTNPYLALADGTTEAYFEIASSVTRISSGTSQPLAFRIGSSEAARLDSSGRLLVGTSDGSGGVSKLVVQGASNGSAVGVAQISYNGLSSAVLAADTDIGYLRFTDQGSNSGVFAQITASTDGTTGASDYPGRLVFSTTADGASSPTERLRITSTGQVRLAGAGITFNGDTAAANELDDYEEGTWTPSVGGTATYSDQNGTYTKIGRTVTINFRSPSHSHSW